MAMKRTEDVATGGSKDITSLKTKLRTSCQDGQLDHTQKKPPLLQTHNNMHKR